MSESTPITLYEFGPTRAVKVRWLLEELGAPFEAVQVNLRKGEQRTPEFLAIHPLGKLPALKYGDQAIFESGAIMTFLADLHPERRMIPPAGTVERALHDQWMFYCIAELEQPLWRIAKHAFIYPEDKRLPAEQELAREDFRRAAEPLEKHLAGREVLVGDSVTAADLSAAYTLHWATRYGLLEGFPGLQAWMEGMKARPTCPEAMK